MIARFAVASVVLLVGGFCIGDDKKSDKDLLQGEWVVVSAEIAGRKAERLEGKKLVVKGDDWTPPTGGKIKMKFKLDDAKTPKHLDLVGDVDGNERTWPGIYKIEGNTFTFCRSAGPGGERPTEFKSGDGASLMVFKRAEKK